MKIFLNSFGSLVIDEITYSSANAMHMIMPADDLDQFSIILNGDKEKKSLAYGNIDKGDVLKENGTPYSTRQELYDSIVSFFNKGRGALTIPEELVFTGADRAASIIARDAFFTLNPTRLKSGIDVLLLPIDGDDTIQKYNGSSWIDSSSTYIGPKGDSYTMKQAWASDSNGTGWSLTPSDLLKYSAFIPWLSTNPTPPTSGDYAGAKWQKTGSDSTAIIVSSYADMLAITPSTSIIKCLVTSDNQNNNGEQSEYNIWPNGTIMWQASINIQNL